MEDSQIVALYLQRNERAIEETASKYGHYCFKIAYNILANREDADESVNDTYMKTWECIPPHQPSLLSAFVGKITRRLSLNRRRDKNRLKRGGGQVALALEELDECIPGGKDVEQELERKELSRAINAFLGTLSEKERDVFVYRYWLLASVQEVSDRFGYSEGKTKTMLFRTREKLKSYLGKEGYL